MTNYAKWALLAAMLVMPALNVTAADNSSNGTDSKSNSTTSAIKTVTQNTTFGGYVIGTASLNNQDEAVHSNFQ